MEGVGEVWGLGQRVCRIICVGVGMLRVWDWQDWGLGSRRQMV